MRSSLGVSLPLLEFRTFFDPVLNADPQRAGSLETGVGLCCHWRYYVISVTHLSLALPLWNVVAGWSAATPSYLFWMGRQTYGEERGMSGQKKEGKA